METFIFIGLISASLFILLSFMYRLGLIRSNHSKMISVSLLIFSTLLVFIISATLYKDFLSIPGGVILLIGISIVTGTSIVSGIIQLQREIKFQKKSDDISINYRSFNSDTEDITNQIFTANNQASEINVSQTLKFNTINVQLPYAKNFVFTGRDDVLEKLSKTLNNGISEDNIKSENAFICLTGMAGIGKTQTAIEFCYRYKQAFTGIFWINAREDNFEFEIVRYGQSMNISPWPENLSDQILLTINKWREMDNILLVIDDIEELSILRKWLPSFYKLKLLITSRISNWPRDLGINEINLDVFTNEASRTLLRKLAPHLEEVPDIEFDVLLEKMGGLPLAIDLAARYLNDRKDLTIKDYINELDTYNNALKHPSLANWESENSPTNHSTYLINTFKIYWDRLLKDTIDPLTFSDVFILASYCAPNCDIPRELFTTILDVWDENTINRAIKLLSTNGFIHTYNGSITIHPLLMNFAQSLPGNDEHFLNIITNGINNYCEKVLVEEHPSNYLMIPHLKHICSLNKIKELLIYPELLAKQGQLLHNQALFNDAQALFGQALQIAEKYYEKNQLQTTKYIRFLGENLSSLGKFTEAIEFISLSLELKEKNLGPDHPDLVIDINIIGDLLCKQEDYAGAKASYQRALTIDEAAFGPDHPNVAICVNNLGSVLLDQGDYARARDCFQRALTIDEAAFGPDHPNVARDANNLGSVLQDQGDNVGARACFERALTIDESVFGPDHPNVATDVNNLGSVLHSQGDFTGARACFERALTIDEAAFGPDHPKVAIRVNNLGRVLHDLGNLPDAQACYERALRIDEAAYGPDHPKVAIRVNNLGLGLQALGDLSGSKACYERALRIDEAAYGPDHPKVAIRVNNLGRVLHDLGNLPDAQACYERALRIDEAVFGPDHPKIARDVNNMGSVLQDTGDYAGARDCYERALKIDETVFGPNHPEVARDVNNLGHVLQTQGDYTGAKACYERALTIDEAVFGPDHPEVATDITNMGSVLVDMGDYARAKACYKRALRIDETIFGPDHPNVYMDFNNLGKVFMAQRNYYKGSVNYQRALSIWFEKHSTDHPNIRLAQEILASQKKNE